MTKLVNIKKKDFRILTLYQNLVKLPIKLYRNRLCMLGCTSCDIIDTSSSWHTQYVSLYKILIFIHLRKSPITRVIRLMFGSY